MEAIEEQGGNDEDINGPANNQTYNTYINNTINNTQIIQHNEKTGIKIQDSNKTNVTLDQSSLDLSEGKHTKKTTVFHPPTSRRSSNFQGGGSQIRSTSLAEKYEKISVLFQEIADELRGAPQQPHHEVQGRRVEDQLRSVERKVSYLAQCMQTGKQSEYDTAYDELVAIVVSYDDENGPAIAEKIAAKYGEERKHLEAILMYQLVSKASLSLDKPTMADIVRIQHSEAEIVNVSVSMFKNDSTAFASIKVFVMKAMKDVIEDLLALKDKGDCKEVLHNVAWCYKCIGSLCTTIKDHNEAASSMNKGVEYMEEAYGHNAKQRKLYGLLQGAIGKVYFKLKQIDEAYEWLQNASDSLKASNGWDNEEEKRNVIEENARNLAKAEVNKQDGGGISSLLDILKPLSVNMEIGEFSNFDEQIKLVASIVEKSDDENIGFIIKAAGDHEFQNGNFILAALICQFTSRAFMKQQNVSENSVKIVQHSVGKITECIEALAKTGEWDLLIKSYILPSIELIIEDIKRMYGAKEHVRVHNVAWSYKCLGVSYSYLHLTKEAEKAMLSGIDAMSDHYGVENASRYRIVGMLRSSLGNVLSEENHHSKALEYYKEAANELHKSLDWESEVEKQKCIRVNAHNITAASLKANENEKPFDNDEFKTVLNMAETAVVNRNFSDFKKYLADLSTIAQRYQNPAYTLLNKGIDMQQEENDYIGSICVFLSISGACTVIEMEDSAIDVIQNGIGRIVNLIEENLTMITKEVVESIFLPAINLTIKNFDRIRATLEQSWALSLAWCYCHLVRLQNHLEKYNDGIENGKETIIVMKKYFSDTYAEYKVLFYVKLRLGQAYMSLKDQKKASNWFAAAHRAINASLDWDDNEDKEKAKQMIKTVLEMHKDLIPSDKLDNCTTQ